MYRAVTDSINQVINTCTVSAPGQNECDGALRQIQVNILMIPSNMRSVESIKLITFTVSFYYSIR